MIRIPVSTCLETEVSAQGVPSVDDLRPTRAEIWIGLEDQDLDVENDNARRRSVDRPTPFLPGVIDFDDPPGYRRRHEILFRSGVFPFSVGRDPGQEEALMRFRNAFVCIPASMDDRVRAALGIPAPGLRG